MTFKRTLLAAAITGATFAAGSAHATNGYFSHGFGVKSSGMAGGGVAFANDSAMIIAANPAGITDVSNQVTGELTWFSPRRGYDYETTVLSEPNPFGVPAGTKIPGSGTSDSEAFFIPSFAFTYALSEKDSVGLAVYGNGGMNTDFAADEGNYLGFPGVDATGPYGDGKAGVNLEQLFIAPTYARKLMEDKLSVGVSALIVRQKFKADGLGNFDGSGPLSPIIGQVLTGQPVPLSFSAEQGEISGHGHDKAWGYGGKIGLTYEATDRISLGASYQTQIRMDDFDDYSGLFAEGGNFDIPATWTVGIAAKPIDDVTVTFDYQRIQYGDVKAISNPSTAYLFDAQDPNACNAQGGPRCLGGEDGAGFGWDDINVFKLGVQWQATPKLQLRAGWNRGDNPISGDDALFNTIAPGVVENHYTAGFSYAFNQNHQLHGAFMYAPEVEVSGSNDLITALSAGTVGQELDIYMKQYSATVGYTYKF